MRTLISRVPCLGLIGLMTLLAAGTAEAEKPKTGAILPGGNSSKPINIQAAKLDYFDKEQKLIYTGDVVAVQGDSKLKASVLTIFLAPKKTGEGQTTQASTNQVQHMIAKGPVTLLQRDQIGTGDNGVYDKASNTVVLTGNVTLSQGPNVTKGEKLVYDLRTGQAVVSAAAGKGVSSMFIPSSNESADTGSGTETAPATPAKKSAKTRRTGG